MSTDYYAVGERNEEALLAALDGDENVTLAPIATSALAERITRELAGFEPFAKDFAAIAKTMEITEADARKQFGSIELNWSEDGYIQLEFAPGWVVVSHGAGGDRQLEVLEGLMAIFADEGLHVWDPQNEDWLE